MNEGDPTAYSGLDAGESTVLSAAAAARAAVLLDERKARAAVTNDPHLRETIRAAIGTIGLILLAKRRGKIAAVRPLVDELIRQGFRIGPALYQDVLHQAGEE